MMVQMTELKVPKNATFISRNHDSVTLDNPDLVVSRVIEEVQSTKQKTDECYCFLSLTELPTHDQSVV